MTRPLVRLLLMGGLLMGGAAAGGQGQAPQLAPPGLEGALAGLAERVHHYYERIGTIICEETVTQQELKFNLAPIGKPRITVYELSVTHDTLSKDGREFRLERKLQTVNGKPARKNQEPECTDPKTGTPEPLEFLLAGNQHGYRFSYPLAAGGGPPRAIAIDFVQTPPYHVDIKWKGNCFEASGGGEEGRLWFDPETFDVLQLEVRLRNPFPILEPSTSATLHPAVSVEKSETTVKFTRVKFEKPDETVLLPESTQTVTVFRGVPSLRTVETLANFRRFLTESTVRPAL
ncbi:MAG TPA: hypothetical protein VGZ27_08110 [Vicinamibacterales bacterium]|jgi:hypothetical protein|nr:hypothetical protein [Vicinamibacterales bacterium]